MNFSAHTANDPFVTDLIAGQHTDAGDIKVWNDGTDLYVMYETAGGWMLTETQLEVETTLADIAQTGSGSPKVGKFEYKNTYDPPVTEDTYVIPLDGWGPGTTLYLAAHAVVIKQNDDGSWQEETGWGNGTEFDKSWAMYFTYEVQEDDGKILNIPEDPIDAGIYYHMYADSAFFDVQLLFEGTGYDVYDEEWYDGWCGDSVVLLNPGQVYNEVNLYQSTDLASLPDYAKDDEQWDMVNYILNQDYETMYGANWRTIQNALWYFTDANPEFDPDGLAGYDPDIKDLIVADALANGAGFFPESGDWMAIILDTNDGVTQYTQLVFIVVDP
jgi:hypothetical protein